MIYKILTPAQHAILLRDGTSPGSPLDVADGFVHLSGPDTLQDTLDLHFTAGTPLVIAEIDPDILGDALVWESSRGGTLFPHLYAPLQSVHIRRHWTVEAGADGRYVAFPMRKTQ